MLTMSVSALTLACSVYLVRNKAHPKTSEFDFNLLIGHRVFCSSHGLIFFGTDFVIMGCTVMAARLSEASYNCSSQRWRHHRHRLYGRLVLPLAWTGG